MENLVKVNRRGLVKVCFIFNICLVLPFISSGQKNQKFQEFLERFPPKALPTVIAFERNEFDYGYYSDENLGDETDSSVTRVEISGQEYQNSVLVKDDSLMITYELVQQYLMADSESVAPTWQVEGVTTDTLFPIYYVSSRLQPGKSFICVIYERQFIIGSGDNAEKYLCTMSKKGKLIDKILVASANYSGTGIMGDSFRVPWFPNVRSEIQQDLSIHFIDANQGYSNYKINNKGKIVKIEEGN